MESEVEVDIPCDPTQIDHTGLPWTFLDEAAHPDRIVEGRSSLPATLKIRCMGVWLH